MRLTVVATALLAAFVTTATATTTCDTCTQRYNFCIENGHTHGQEGCKQTCAEHVCYMLRKEGMECNGCGEAFGVCGGKPRYV